MMNPQMGMGPPPCPAHVYDDDNIYLTDDSGVLLTDEDGALLVEG